MIIEFEIMVATARYMISLMLSAIFVLVLAAKHT